MLDLTQKLLFAMDLDTSMEHMESVVESGQGKEDFNTKFLVPGLLILIFLEKCFGIVLFLSCGLAVGLGVHSLVRMSPLDIEKSKIYKKKRKSGGEIFFQGKDIVKYGRGKQARFRNQNVGFVFQYFRLFEELTARENILLPPLIGRKKPNLRHYQNVIAQMGLEDRQEHLSGKCPEASGSGWRLPGR